MKNLKIRRKISLGFIVIIALFISSSSYYLGQINKLGQLQDEEARLSDNAVLITEYAEMGNTAYSVFADAIINRNITENKKEWELIKEEAITDLDNVQDIVDTPEEEMRITEVKNVMNDFFGLYDELLVLLEKDDSSEMSEIIALDAKAGEYKEQAHDLLINIQKSLHNKMIRSDEEFNSKSRYM